jgi:hypothetical protein
VSFDLFLASFLDGEPAGLDENKIKAAFGLALVEKPDSTWRLVYGPGFDYSDVYYSYYERNPSQIAFLTVDRPVQDSRLWASLYDVMLLGNVVLFWPSDSGDALVANRDVIQHLPPSFRAEAGEPDVIDRAEDIYTAIRGRRFVYLRRQRGDTLYATQRGNKSNTNALSSTTELKWLDQYAGETTEELLALVGTYRLDSLVLAFEEAIGQKEARNEDEGLTDEEMVVLAIEALEREVNNGGYHQFFVNALEFAPVILSALHRIGCHEVAQVTHRAIVSMGIGDTPTVEVIADVICEADARRDMALQTCNEEYFAKAPCLAEPLYAFIQTHKEKIRLP